MKTVQIQRVNSIQPCNLVLKFSIAVRLFTVFFLLSVYGTSQLRPFKYKRVNQPYNLVLNSVLQYGCLQSINIVCLWNCSIKTIQIQKGQPTLQSCTAFIIAVRLFTVYLYCMSMELLNKDHSNTKGSNLVLHL